jgi:phosphoglycerate dehydrogenase-like enzyme
MKPMNIITDVKFSEPSMARLRALVAPGELHEVSTQDKERLRALVGTCEVAFLSGAVDPLFYGPESAVKWIHCNSAGLNQVAKAVVFEKGLLVSGGSGRSAPALAEHVFFFILSHVYRVRELLENQRNHRWDASRLASSESPSGKTLGIIGFGNTGKAVYEKAKAFGMKMIAYSNAPIPHDYDLLLSLSRQKGDSLYALLERCDYLVVCTNLSDLTYHLLDEEAFSHVKKGCFLVNIGRGEVIEEKALVQALRSDILSGAGLDVTEPEPLAHDSELWDMDQVMITPHFTPRMTNFEERCLDIFAENLRRYTVGMSLLNVLDKDDLYTK